MTVLLTQDQFQSKGHNEQFTVVDQTDTCRARLGRGVWGGLGQALPTGTEFGLRMSFTKISKATRNRPQSSEAEATNRYLINLLPVH